MATMEMKSSHSLSHSLVLSLLDKKESELLWAQIKVESIDQK